MYQRTDKGRRRAIEHPLYAILQSRPNNWQSSFEWREQCMTHVALRGAAYSRIQLQRGKRTLTALNPDRVNPHLHDDGTLSVHPHARGEHTSSISLIFH
jgi:phage portal protein BeeE